MKRKNEIIITLVLVASLVVIYLLLSKNQSNRIVKLKGANVYSNVSKSNMTWMVGNNSDSISAMPLVENDVVYMVFDEDKKEFCYRYRKSDGLMLEFRIHHFMLLLDNKLISIKVINDEELNSWLENVSNEAVKDLRSVFISDEISGVNMKYMKRLSELKPEIGIYIDNQSEETDTLLKLFRPLWLIDFNKKYSPEAIQLINQSKKLDLLRVDADMNDLNEFADLTSLKSLFIQNLNQPQPGQELKLLKWLKTLSISESGIKNLDFLKTCHHLRELSLIDCESLSDISALSDLPRLRTLNLLACDSLKDINVTSQIPGLKWISFPNGIDQKEFDAFLNSHKSIEIIDLIGCDSIVNFAGMKELKKLSCLSIQGMDPDIESILQLTNLKYLSLPEKITDDSASISLLKEKLPETIIVPSAGICLGSGWILMFIPFLLISGLCVIHFRKTGYGKNIR
jgi:hypothetical protein